MSAIAGVFTRDGSPIETTALDRVERALRGGPYRQRRTALPGVAMITRQFDSRVQAPASAPSIVDDRGWLVSFHGRLDNVPELCDLFGGDRTGARASAPQLVLALYRCFGTAGFARLVGDFALALWDPRGRRLVLASDALGRLPLYYHCSERCLYWASTCRALRDVTTAAATVSDVHVAEFLTNSRITTSPFTHVELLGGGHALTVDAATSTRTCYWSLAQIPEIHHRRDRDYEEHFRSVFEQAVSCRLDSGAPVVCELSGGLDSSSIACLAHLDSRQQPAGLRTLSYVFDQASHDDERRYISIVEEALGQRGIHVSELQCPLLAPLAATCRPDVPTNAICFVSRSDHVVALMRSIGSRVLLSGRGGDQLFWSQPDMGTILSDLLAAGQITALVGAARQWSKVVKRPVIALLLEAVTPLLPRRWQKPPVYGAWFQPRFERLHVRDRMRPATAHGALGPSAAVRHAMVAGATRPNAVQPCLTEGFIDQRHPFLDRRMAEFALGIPLDQHVRVGESRSIIRRSLHGIVPPAILDRRTKAGPDESLLRAFVHQWHMLSELAADPLAAAFGFIDRDRFQQALTRARHGQSVNTSQLLRTISLELWLRTLENAPAPDDATAVDVVPALVHTSN